jgi:methyl coenzyme M reductase subunit C-like uncharacterized protein (methanogenesis marker protein 7)
MENHSVKMFSVNDRVEAVDSVGLWCNATIIEDLDGDRVKVTFDNYGPEWDEAISRKEDKIRLPSDRRKRKSNKSVWPRSGRVSNFLLLF